MNDTLIQKLKQLDIKLLPKLLSQKEEEEEKQEKRTKNFNPKNLQPDKLTRQILRTRKRTKIREVSARG